MAKREFVNNINPLKWMAALRASGILEHLHGAGVRAVLLSIYSRLPTPRPGLEILAKESGMEVRSTRYCLAYLRAVGLLVEHGGANHARTFELADITDEEDAGYILFRIRWLNDVAEENKSRIIGNSKLLKEMTECLPNPTKAQARVQQRVQQRVQLVAPQDAPQDAARGATHCIPEPQGATGCSPDNYGVQPGAGGDATGCRGDCNQLQGGLQLVAGGDATGCRAGVQLVAAKEETEEEIEEVIQETKKESIQDSGFAAKTGGGTYIMKYAGAVAVEGGAVEGRAVEEWTEKDEEKFRKVWEAYWPVKRDKIDDSRAAYRKAGVNGREALSEIRRLQKSVKLEDVKYQPRFIAWIEAGGWIEQRDLVTPQMSEYEMAMAHFAVAPDPVRSRRIVSQLSMAYKAKYGKKVVDNTTTPALDRIKRVVCNSDLDTNPAAMERYKAKVPEDFSELINMFVAEYGDPDATPAASETPPKPRRNYIFNRLPSRRKSADQG